MLAVVDHMPWAILGVLLGRNVNVMSNWMVMNIWMHLHGHLPTYHDDVAALGDSNGVTI